MSSYQFVNSLASSCYGVGRGGTATGAGGDLSGMTAADYYASAMSSYQNCYPVAGQQQQQQPQQPQQQHYADFGQHQQQQQHMPMSPMSNGGVDFNSMTGMQQQPMQQQQARLQQQPIQQQQSMRGPSVVQQQQRLNPVASPVHLGKKDFAKLSVYIGRHDCEGFP